MSKLNKYARTVQSTKSHKRSAVYHQKSRSPWSHREAEYHRGVARIQDVYKTPLSRQEKQIIYDRATCSKR